MKKSKAITPVIVTLTNDCFEVLSAGWLSISQPGGSFIPVPNGGYFSCRNLETGNYKDVFNNEIKLIARKARKRTTSPNY
jgi:hypothetical protein